MSELRVGRQETTTVASDRSRDISEKKVRELDSVVENLDALSSRLGSVLAVLDGINNRVRGVGVEGQGLMKDAASSGSVGALTYRVQMLSSMTDQLESVASQLDLL